jgi:ubiquinone biosynthesis protein
MKTFLRLWQINKVILKYGLDDVILSQLKNPLLKIFFKIQPVGWTLTNRQKTDKTKSIGERLFLFCEELGPVFIKFGQILSVRIDMLPTTITKELAKLQDNVKAFDGEIACQAIEKSLQIKIDEIFLNFETKPLAQASVAQVHSATLKNKEKVIVKIIRPGIKKIIDADIVVLKMIAKIIQKTFVDGKRANLLLLVAEFEKTIYRELDLRLEAAHAQKLKENFNNDDNLFVPKIYWDYIRKNILISEKINGFNVNDIQSMQKQNYDLKLLAEKGVQVFFTQVFKHNFFHADMHPGNVFVAKNNPNNPSYIAVDFGIMASLSPKDQQYVADVLLAFFDKDYHRIARLHKTHNLITDDSNITDFEIAIMAVCEPIFAKPLKDISFATLLINLFVISREYNLQVQPQLLLLEKTLLNIESLGKQLYPKLDLWQTAKPFLEQYIREQKSPKKQIINITEKVPDFFNKINKLTSSINKIDKNNQIIKKQEQQNRTLKIIIAILLTALVLNNL